MRTRRSIIVIATIAVLFGLGAAVPVEAASAHFKRGGTPVCRITTSTSSSSTTCGATLSGLGNGDLNIDVTVRGFAVYQCRNGGGQTAPGQNRVLTGPVTAPTVIPDGAIKNGNVAFTTNPAVLTAADTVSGAEAGCPNANWTGVNPTLTVTSITMTIAQGGTTLFSCGAVNLSGLSGTVALTC